MRKGLLLFIFLSITASALNYIVYPLFSRILPPSEYVSITTSLSLFTQVSTFLSSILAITIGLSKRQSQNEDGNHTTIEVLQSFLFKLFGILAIFFLLLSPVIMTQVHTPTLFAIPICVMMILSIPLLVISGYLNGRNLMVKLGIVTLITALSQFIIGASTGLLTHNGLATMASMSIAQIITLGIIYSVFPKEQLPGITKSITTKVDIKSRHIRNLLVFTAFTSFAIMAISLTQVADLFVVQNLHGVKVKLYTDLYVVSRVVFFAGMIFIWPFLGETSLEHHRHNLKPFFKVVSFFTIITIPAIVIMYLLGDRIGLILFGAHYQLTAIQLTSILSITYKFLLLIITAVVLYFVVLRSYLAIVIAFLTSGFIFLYAELSGTNQSIVHLLLGFNGIAVVMAVIGSILIFKTPIKIQRL